MEQNVPGEANSRSAIK